MDEAAPADDKSLSIYDARLTFRKTKTGSRMVGVCIRYSKRGRTRKEKLPVPAEINDGEIYWIGFRGELISVYHRMDDNYRYVNSTHPDNSYVHKGLAQKLEALVLGVLSDKPI